MAFVNCRVYKKFQPLEVADALVVGDGRIVYVGERSKAMSIARTHGGSVIDLNGAIVMPGFIDAHMHLGSFGLFLNSLDLRNVKSINELKRKLEKFVNEHRELRWIIGRGWDQELFEERRWPTRWDLDSVVADRPVVLTRVCGHAAVLNSKALKYLLETLHIPLNNPLLDRDDKGELTGVIKEDLVWRLNSSIEFSSEEILKFLIDGMENALKYGVTTLGFVSCSPKSLFLLQTLYMMRGSLPTRIRVYLEPETLPHLKALGISRGFGNEYLKIMGIKILADGSLGARTAWLTKPYADDPKNLGTSLISVEELSKVAKESLNQNLQLSIHAIGDRTLDLIIDVFSKLSTDIGIHRFRIEHASITRPDQVEKLAKLGVVVVIQPHFVITDYWVIDRLGTERAPWIYPFKSMIRAGIKLGLSTDCPVEPINPWETVYAAVTRGEYEGVELAQYTGYEKLSIAEALHYYTLGSAYALFEENHIGSIETGKYADFIVVDKDPLTLNYKELKYIKNLMTIVGGRIVYRAKS